MKNLLALSRERQLITLIDPVNEKFKTISRDFYSLDRSLKTELQDNLKLLQQAEDEALKFYSRDYQSCLANFLGSLKALKEAPGSQVEDLGGYDLIEKLFTSKEEIYQQRNKAIKDFYAKESTLDKQRALQQELKAKSDNLLNAQELVFEDVRWEMRTKYELKLLDAKKVAISKENAIDPQARQDYFDNIKQVCAYIELEDGRIFTENNYQEVLSCLKSCKFTFHPAQNAHTNSHKMTFLEMISGCLHKIKRSEEIENKEKLIKSFEENLKQFVKTAGEAMLEKLKIHKFTKLLLEQKYPEMLAELPESYTLDNMSIYEISSLYSIGDYFAISSRSYQHIHERILSKHIGQCVLDTREIDPREKPVSKSAVIIIADNVPLSASFFQRQYDSFKEEKLFDTYILLGSGDLNLERFEAVFQLKNMAVDLKDFDKIIMQIWSHNEKNDPRLAVYITALQDVFRDSAATIISEIYSCYSNLYQDQELGLITRKNFFIITTAPENFYPWNYDLCDYIDCLKNGSGPVDYFASKYAEPGSAMISSLDIAPSTFDAYLGNIAMSINWFI